MAIIQYNKNPIENFAISSLSNAYSFADEARRSALNLSSPSGFSYSNYIDSLYNKIDYIKKNLKSVNRWIDDTIYSFDKLGSDILSDLSKFAVDTIDRENSDTNKL